MPVLRIANGTTCCCATLSSDYSRMGLAIRCAATSRRRQRVAACRLFWLSTPRHLDTSVSSARSGFKQGIESLHLGTYKVPRG